MSGALEKIENGVKPLARWAALFSSLAVFGIIGWFWYTHAWKPKVALSNIDYEKGTADVSISDVLGRFHDHKLFAGSAVSAGGGWGVRFSGDNPISTKFNRIELVKNNLTFKVLDVNKT
jgi:hypothetical protein